MELHTDMTIGEVADRAGVATSAIRHYEARGLIRAARTSGNQRRFHRSVLRRLAVIRSGQRLGRSLDEIAEVLGHLPDDEAPTATDWAVAATAWRGRLDEQIDALTALRDQLDGCIGCGCLSLERCAIYNPADTAGALGAGPRFLLGDRPRSEG